MVWDPKRKGYIGVTRQPPKKRWKQHRSSDSLVGQKIREDGLEYGDMHILEEGLSGAQAREKECKYRPEGNIGWNKKSGGGGIDDNQTDYNLYHIPPKRRVKHLVIWAVVVVVLAFILLRVIF